MKLKKSWQISEIQSKTRMKIIWMMGLSRRRLIPIPKTTKKKSPSPPLKKLNQMLT
jgi:hypothetical protein